MAKWIEVCNSEEVPAGERKFIDVQGQPICLFNIDGQLHAIANICPHAGLPLAQGELCGKVITCPFHGYAYNVETGKNVDYADDIPVAVYPIRMQGQKLEIDLEPHGN